MDTVKQSEEFKIGRGIHREGCRCNKCFAVCMGKWIDDLALETSTGCWQVFATTTFRTPNYIWKKGFPMGQSTNRVLTSFTELTIN